MDSRHQRYFVAVAEELHFGRAAERLRISQPALSKQIRGLEEELGTELLWRTKRSVRLTPAGVAFLRSSRDVLGRMDRAVHEARGIGRGELGSVTLGYMSGASVRLVPRIVRAFRARHPKVEVRLTQFMPPDHAEVIRDGRVDVGLLHLPPAPEDLAVERLAEESFLIALPARHPLAKRSSLSLRDLDGAPLVFFPRYANPQLHDEFTGLFKRVGATPNFVLETLPAYGILAAVAAGIGAAPLTESLRDIRWKGVVYRTLTGPRPSFHWGVAYTRGPRPRTLDLFLDVVRRLYR
ncbi:MAG TPA: LysR substrate-binding domain-containing protein [Planctomycetota bacterium]